MSSPIQFSINSDFSQKLSVNKALKDSVSALGQEMEQLFSAKLNTLLQQFGGSAIANVNIADHQLISQESVNVGSPSVNEKASTASFLTIASAGGSAGISPAAAIDKPSPLQLSNHEFRSGNIGLKLHRDGERISQVVYYGNNGEVKGSSAFYAPEILKAKEKFDVNLADLKGIGTQLDAAGIGYKPYEQYAKEGSNHGIDFDDLANGGMGTAFDWTNDANVHLKGPSAVASLKENQELAERLGLKFKEWGSSNSSTTVSTKEIQNADVSVNSANPKVNNLPNGSVDTTDTPRASLGEQFQSNELRDLVQDIIQQMVASNQLKIQSEL